MSAATFSVTVESSEARKRLDRFLAAVGTWGTRSQVHRLITDGRVRIDGRIAKPGTLLRCGQRIEIEPSPPPATSVTPEPIPLDVLYEDDWLLAVNKPAGLVVHPAAGHWQGTLVSALLHRWQGRPAGLDPLRPGIVHRLDKDTSGVLVIAKDGATLATLGRQFRSREVAKEYLALVWGTPRPRAGEVRRPIGRHPTHRKRMTVRAGGRAAVTRYEVVSETAAASLLRVFPETGRTHQIRVHLAALGHPIVGDAVYGGRRRRDPDAGIDRQALHASRLTLRHPHTGAALRLAAPLPSDFQRALGRLGLSCLTSNMASSSVSSQDVSNPSRARPYADLGTTRSSHRASSQAKSLREERM